MEGAGTYIDDLHRALAKQEVLVEQQVVPRLREQFRAYYSAFQALYNVLLKKSLVAEDPYKYDTKISEIEPPVDEGYAENEREDQLAVRMSGYDSQLDFLNTSYQFSTDFLNLRRLKALIKLARFVRWTHFSPGSTAPTTRALAEQVDKVRGGSDKVSSGVVNDSLNQLSKAQNEVLADLKRLVTYQKERYKAMVRADVIGGEAEATGEEALRGIKRKFAQVTPNKPFFPDLVSEILAEDAGPDKDRLRKEVLDSLAVADNKPATKRKQDTSRAILMDAVRSMANAGRPLDECVERISENYQLVANRTLTLGEKFKRWLRKVAGQPTPKGKIELEYVDITTSARSRETIDFDEFVQGISRRTRIYNGIIGRMGNTYRKLEAAGDDQVLAFLSRQIEELQLTHRRLEALDVYFKSEAERDDRGKLRGIKIELSTLKNAIVNSNQKRAEFVANKEETEQLKKLGVDMGS